MQKYIIIMPRAITNNLDKVSKKNVLNVEVFADNKYSSLTHTFKIPFKELEEPMTAHRSYFNVIGTFSDVIIDALEKRMESCVDMLSRNLFNIVESNEFHIMFKKEDGSCHSFNHISFRVMQEAIRFINEERLEDLGKRHYDQILKALYWIENPAPRNGVSFGNLVSMCMDVMHTSLN